MFCFILDLATYQIAHGGSLLTFAIERRRKCRGRKQSKLAKKEAKEESLKSWEEAKAERRERSPKRTERTRPYRKDGEPQLPEFTPPVKDFEILFDAPNKCCNLYDEIKYNCIKHPGIPPKKYFEKELRTTHLFLTRAYRVDLLVHTLPIKRAFAALHGERRKLGLEELPDEWHFHGYQPPTYKYNKGICLGNLCLLHLANMGMGSTFHRESCFLCRANKLRNEAVNGCQRIYRDYRVKHAAAVQEVNERMGWKLFACKPPSESPVKEWSIDGHPRVRVTDWKENSDGKQGNISVTARYKAIKAEQRKVDVWTRMRRNPRPLTPSSTCLYMMNQPLGTIKETEEE